jgi:hypothetical protein
MKTGNRKCCRIYCANSVSENFLSSISSLSFFLSLSPIRCFYLYRTRSIPTKQHFQITVIHHEGSDSIVASNKHVTISTQTTNIWCSVMQRHTCNCERKVLSNRNTEYFNIHPSHDFILEHSTDIRMFIHINSGWWHGRIDYFTSCLAPRVDSGRWLLDREPQMIEPVFIQWKFYQVPESMNYLGNWMKTGKKATRISFTS